MGDGGEAVRRAAKVDNTHVEIVLALKRAGYVVKRCSDTGMPDLWVTHPKAVGRGWMPLEVKTNGNPLTPAQVRWWETVGEAAGDVVNTPDGAVSVANDHFFGGNDGSGDANG